jgi:hypothetical protein
MLGIKKESAWTFKTSGSGGVAAALSVEGGVIVLKDPKNNLVRFYYGAVGCGPSGRLKLPFKIKVPRYLLKIIYRIFGNRKYSRAVAPTVFKSWGWVFITDTFKGDELSVSDINGPCAFFEAGAGEVVGGAAYAMLLGMDPKLAAKYLQAVITQSPSAVYYAVKMLLSATGLLIMGGFNVSFGWGAGVYLGYLGNNKKVIAPAPTASTQRYPLPPRVPAQPLAHNRLASAGVRNTQNQNRKSLRHEDKHHYRHVIPKQQYSEIAPNVFQFNCPHPIFTDQPQLYINLSCKEIEEKEKPYGGN